MTDEKAFWSAFEKKVMKKRSKGRSIESSTETDSKCKNLAFVIMLRRFILTDEKAFWSAFDKKVMKNRSKGRSIESSTETDSKSKNFSVCYSAT